MRRTLVLGTAGHIDHGKSALVEALTGIHPDRLKEEQARGITIDLGFAHAAIGDVRVAFVDVPGHERFVRNMLAGAGGIDAVLLVVAADESVMPQTREHFHICRLLGIGRGVVAVSKADLADAEMRAVTMAEIRALVAGSFLHDASIVPVSSRTGEGLPDLRRAIAALAAPAARHARDGLVRMPIDRVFTVKGFGAVVTGTLVSGRVGAGDELTVLPADRRVRVRGLQVHGGTQQAADAPSRLAANLAGIEAADLSRGMTLATPGSLALATQIDVHLTLLDDAPPLRHGARVRVHHGTSELRARVAVAAVRAGEGEWQAAAPGAAAVAVPPGGEAFARLRLEAIGVLTRGDRVVLRSYSPAATIGGARVLDPEPPRTRLRRAGVLDRFQRLDRADARAALDLFLREASGRGLDAGAAIRRAGMGAAQAAEMLHAPDVIAAADRIFHAPALDDATAAILRTLDGYHASHPLEGGMPRGALRQAALPGAAPEIFELAMDRLAGEGRLAGTERIALAGHAPQLSDDDRRLRDEITRRLQRAGLVPPGRDALASDLSATPQAVDRALHALVREKALTRVGDLVFHVEALAALKAEIRGLRDRPGGGRVDVAMFKQRYGLTRKFAIPLLEWLDRERVTRRAGDARVVL
jgi:selenocysteine-specific elongation factor